jgi:ankyrin repeat protein
VTGKERLMSTHHRRSSVWGVTLLAFLGIGAAAGEPPIISAVKRADAQAVRTALTQGGDVNAAAPDGTTALHWAVHHDSGELVNLLIRAGAAVKAANRYGVTPLALACINGSAAIVEALLTAGADPSTASAEGETVLMTAARTGNADVVRLLLAAGADVNAKETWRGQTPLMWAIAEEHLPVVRVLLERGADIEARTAKGFSPFLFAVRSGDFDMVRALLAAGANVNDAGGDGTTALVVAIVNAHFELAAFLLEQGADVTTDMPGGTALHAVTRTRNYEYGTVVRPAAVQTGRLDAMALARILLEYGADPDAQIVKPLPRQGGFDNNYLRLIGATPFLLAARAADPALMRLLVDHGADPSITTNQNVTPLMVAAGAGYVQGQSIGAPADRLEAVKLALELGADVHATSESAETAMHGAATGGVNAVVELLYARGASLDAKDKDGTTPLAIADGTKSNFRRWDHTAELLRQLAAQAQQQ